ncbi:phosphatase PAP2 family protein [Daejeonella oryzae]|uniref:phosphatase PAP2 family protein n=1 Tax=Daejeonella oryzae TaxID=1122943 RepID=UPI00041F3E09|nr:phosphatase PAP2 family protein [Daejeonella oryzae]
MNTRRKLILFRVLTVLLVGFISLTILISFFPNSIIDTTFSEEVQEHQHPILDSIMKGISFFGYVPAALSMVVGMAVCFYLFKLKREAAFILLTLSSAVVSSILKIAIARPRPTEDLVRIVEKAGNQSFPSGHMLFYVVFFGFMVLLMNHLKFLSFWIRWTIANFSLMIIFAIPFSRIYLGAHWFTDVLGGFLVGLICLAIISYAYLNKPSS